MASMSSALGMQQGPQVSDLGPDQPVTQSDISELKSMQGQKKASPIFQPQDQGARIAAMRQMLAGGGQGQAGPQGGPVAKRRV